jgi:hypothetical protein
MKERPGKALADYFGSQESQPNNDDDRDSSHEGCDELKMPL